MNRPVKSSHQQVASWRNGLGRSSSFKQVLLMVSGSNPSRNAVQMVVRPEIDENKQVFFFQIY